MPTPTDALINRAAAAAEVVDPLAKPLVTPQQYMEQARTQPDSYSAARAYVNVFNALVDEKLDLPGGENLSIGAIYGVEEGDPTAIVVPINSPADIAEAEVNAFLGAAEAAQQGESLTWGLQRFVAFDPSAVPAHSVGGEDYGWPSDLSRFNERIRRDSSSVAIEAARRFTQILKS